MRRLKSVIAFDEYRFFSISAVGRLSLVTVSIAIAVATVLFAGATSEARETTGIEIVIVAEILLTVLLVLVITVLVAEVSGFLVGVEVRVFTSGIFANGTVTELLALSRKVEVLVTSSTGEVG